MYVLFPDAQDKRYQEKLEDGKIFENPLGIRSSHFWGGKTIQALLHIAGITSLYNEKGFGKKTFGRVL